MKTTNMTTKNTSQKGFTLVELMVVVAIIAILAVIGLTVFSGAQKSSRDAKRRADVQSISNALEVHLNTTPGQYCGVAATAPAGSYCPVVAAWFAQNVVPTDPSTGANYPTAVALGNTTYNICATMEVGAAYCLNNRQ